MTNNYDLVIFDLDGTLINTIEDLGVATNYALEQRGYAQHTMTEYRGMVGHGVRRLVINALPEALKHDEALVDECLADFIQYYSAHIDVHTRPYEGIHELLRDLSAAGTALAVASNKFQAGTEALIREYFGDIPFVAILGNRDGWPLKPDAAIVRYAISCAFGTSDASGCGHADANSSKKPIDLSRIIMVGDSATDMQTALNGGIPAIGVTWGFRSRAELSSAPVLVDSVPELRSMLLSE